MKTKKIKDLLLLASTEEDVNEVLTKIGNYESWEAKRAFLEAFCDCNIVGPHNGNDQDSFWATAQAFLDSKPNS